MRSRVAQAWPYIVTVEPSTLPLTINEVKEHLKMNISETVEDALLKILMKTVTAYAEKYTKRDFITRTYETLRDSFGDDLEIRRNPVQSVTKVEYLQDAAFVEVSTDIYFLTASNSYPRLALEEGQAWPTDEDARAQAVKITFKAGYGNTLSNVPDSLREGLLQHIAALYENRGDCSCDFADTNAVQKLLPIGTRLIYDMYRIRSI